MAGELIYYEFSKRNVERCRLSQFVHAYGFDKLPEGGRLREMMDSLVFCVEGYDQDGREIHSIPEVRRFYRTFQVAWPYWLYFCNLELGTLKEMEMCCLPSLTGVTAQANLDAAACDPLDLLNLLQQGLVGMNRVCDRALMFEEHIEQRTRLVFEYFGMRHSSSASVLLAS